MTLGEKIKAARKSAGLTQEQLAEKLLVSRPAIAKWESGKGIPDIENLKALAKLLDVSLDHLLGDDDIHLHALQENIDLQPYGKGLPKTVKDRFMQARFPDAVILTLLQRKLLTKGEKIIDNLIGFLTDAPFGIPDLINSVKLLDSEVYLVTREEKQYLVTVGSDTMQTLRLSQPVDATIGSRFQIGDTEFTVCKFCPPKK